MGYRRVIVCFAALAAALAGTARAQSMERGKELFAMCSHCHGQTAEGDSFALAPSIAGLPAWYIKTQIGKFRDNERAAHFDDIAGMRMRGMAKWLKSDADIDSVAGYIETLPKVKDLELKGGDPAKGAALYAPCSGCHGLNGEGMQAVGAPPLANLSDWYLLTQLRNYQQGIRGRDPRDVAGAAMVPMSQILSDEQAIKDVLAHIATLKGAVAAAPASGGSSE
ncbi:MAG TPA: c-type cytochrome [Myxococcota bacterium]|nr:c-type cytochrome [Myxococcota bacterium]